uniref:Peptidase M14 domain-containing protein n=1 Tax=Strongyloides stercoralis TaxID=6248 RepID=A0AAF5D6L2_STRER
MKSVVEGIGGCCSTEPNLKRVNPSLFEWNSFRINASYNNESSHYYRCFGGCYSTGTESGKWRLFWRELEYRNSFRINARVNKESRKNSSSNNTNYNRESSFPGISKECKLEVESYTDYLVENKIQEFDVGQSADILYGANGCFNDYAKSLGIKYVFTIKVGSRKMYNFGFMIPKSYISKLAEEAFAGILVVSQRVSKENIVESNIE